MKKILTIIKRDGIIFTFKRFIAFALAKTPLWNKLSFSYQNLRLVFAPSSLTYTLFAHRTGRKEDVDMIKKYLPHGGVGIDVGSNIGSLAVIMADRAREQGKVLVFEPSKKFFDITVTNLRVNNLESNVEVYNVALGDREGVVFLDESVKDDTTNFVNPNKKGDVQQQTLDFYTKNTSSIDFVKIDVEGYELAVLKGSPETLSKTKVLYIEFITDNYRNGTEHHPAEIVATLEKYFDVFTSKNSELIPFVYRPGEYYFTDLLCFSRSND